MPIYSSTNNVHNYLFWGKIQNGRSWFNFYILVEIDNRYIFKSFLGVKVLYIGHFRDKIKSFEKY